MYIDSATYTGPNGKTYTRHLLREAFRQGGKVVKRTLGNVSHLSPDQLEALRAILRHEGPIGELVSLSKDLELRQGASVAAVETVRQAARRLGIAEALGSGRQAQLALWQVMARALDQGSRLSAVRLARQLDPEGSLGLGRFDEDDLYENLEWLAEQQPQIETRLFAHRCRQRPPPQLFLYDVTSSYLEGTCNELAAFGYNRDGKRGRKQIVVGLLTDEDGWPLSIELFRGNTQDPATVAPQLRKLAERFGGGELTLVGDRGMLKSRQVQDLTGAGMHYITAITRPQIEALLKGGVLQLGLFDQKLAEVIEPDGRRYVIHRNPLQAERCALRRADQLDSWQKQVAATNAYLAAHPRASPEKALARMQARAARLKLQDWTALELQGRELVVRIDEDARAEAGKLDGAYVLVTDLSPRQASKERIDARYRDLAQVEQVFRTVKTAMLELRPIHVRREARTRGHALVVMLAFQVVRHLEECWRELDVTVQEGLDELRQLCANQVWVRGQYAFTSLPQPRPSSRRLLAAAGVELPAVLPRRRGPGAQTRHPLSARRRPRRSRPEGVVTAPTSASAP